MFSSAPVYALPSTQTQSHHMNTVSASPLTNKVRNIAPANQVSANTRYPPALTPITSTVIQPNTSTVIGTISNNALMTNNRNRVNYNAPGGDEIIDLSSPPHSPQQVNSVNINTPLGSASNYSNYSKPKDNIEQLPEYTSSPHTVPYKVSFRNSKQCNMVYSSILRVTINFLF